MGLIDWLMIAYIALFSALLSRLTALACCSTWVIGFLALFLNIHQSGVPSYSAGMAGATWNCSRLGARSVYTIQPCSVWLHAKPHMCYNWDTIDSIRNNTLLLLATGSCRVRVIQSSVDFTRTLYIYIYSPKANSSVVIGTKGSSWAVLEIPASFGGDKWSVY